MPFPVNKPTCFLRFCSSKNKKIIFCTARLAAFSPISRAEYCFISNYWLKEKATSAEYPAYCNFALSTESPGLSLPLAFDYSRLFHLVLYKLCFCSVIVPTILLKDSSMLLALPSVNFTVILILFWQVVCHKHLCEIHISTTMLSLSWLIIEWVHALKEKCVMTPSPRLTFRNSPLLRLFLLSLPSYSELDNIFFQLFLLLFSISFLPWVVVGARLLRASFRALSLYLVFTSSCVF